MKSLRIGIIGFGFRGEQLARATKHAHPDWIKELKAKAEDIDQEIYAVSANNDFSSPIPEHRECQIVYVHDLIRMTLDLGVKPLRVFLG